MTTYHLPSLSTTIHSMTGVFSTVFAVFFIVVFCVWEIPFVYADDTSAPSIVVVTDDPFSLEDTKVLLQCLVTGGIPDNPSFEIVWGSGATLDHILIPTNFFGKVQAYGYLDNLSPATQYTYQCVMHDGGNTLRGETKTFVTDAIPTLHSVGICGQTIRDGDVVYGDNCNKGVATGLPLVHFSFSWPYMVPNSRTFVGLARGTLGDIEGGDAEDGVNIVNSIQQWGDGENNIVKYLGSSGYMHNQVSLFDDPQTQPSLYTAMVVERAHTFDIDTDADIRAWFASGGSEGVIPLRYATITFEYRGFRSQDAPPTLSYIPTDSYATDPHTVGRGVEPNKGVADKDPLTFATLYTDQDGDNPAYVRLWVKDATGTDTFYTMTRETGAHAPAHHTDGNTQNGEQYTFTGTFPKGIYAYAFLTADTHNGTIGEEVSFPAPLFATHADNPLSFTTGYSNIAFLPGIMASRLYREGFKKWEPDGDSDAQELMLNIDGTSMNPNIYVREGDVIEKEMGVGGGIYNAWMNDLSAWKADGTIRDYAALAYDWRLDFDTLLSGGRMQTEHGEQRIYFDAAYPTSTPYIYSELKRLADTSDSGKVTIVAHSMGGLLGKYALANLEADTTHPYHDLIADKCIDDFIMVATPAWGTPEAVGALLHGERIDKSFLGYDFMSKLMGRQLAQTMTPAFALLPSRAYMEHISSVYPDGWTDYSSRPISFDTSLATLSDPYIIYTAIHAMFGDALDTYPELVAFLRGDEGRPVPEVSDMTHPLRLTNTMISSGDIVHAITDAWTSPDVDNDNIPDIRVVQIAGWGIADTIANISYHAIPKTTFVCTNGTYNCRNVTSMQFVPEPIFTYEGDKTVVLPSASAMDVETYYVNLYQYNRRSVPQFIPTDHSSILEIDSVRNLIENILKKTQGFSQELQHISTNKNDFWRDGAYIRFAMHSPVSMRVCDESGACVGLADDGSLQENIANGYYREFGEGKYLGIPAGETYTVNMTGTDTGTFTLNMTEESGEGTVSTQTFADVSVQEGSTAVFSLTTVDDVPALSLDMNGDGTVDTVVLSEEAKEVVSYDILKQTISVLPNLFSKPLLVQVKVSEALHKRGAVIAEKAILFAIQKEIEKHNCELVKGKKGKKPACIEKTHVLEISAILNAMIENLDTPIKERKDDIHTRITELKEDLKRFFSRR